MSDGRWSERISPHPIHGILLGFPIAFFCGAVASDITFLRAPEPQWTNFSAWLITGGLVFGALLLLWALLALLLNFRNPSRGRRLTYLAVLALMCGFGLVNAFKHSQDGWSSVGLFGMTLSLICAGLALAAGVLAYTGAPRGGAQ